MAMIAVRRSAVAGQIGRPDEAGGGAQGGADDAGEGPVAAAGEGGGVLLAGRVEQEGAGLGHAAADDEAARVEHRSQVGDALPEPAADLVEALARGGVA